VLLRGIRVRMTPAAAFLAKMVNFDCRFFIALARLHATFSSSPFLVHLRARTSLGWKGTTQKTCWS